MNKKYLSILASALCLLVCGFLWADDTAPDSVPSGAAPIEASAADVSETGSSIPSVLPSHVSVTILPFLNRTGNAAYDAASANALRILAFTLKSVKECDVTVLQQDPVERNDAELGSWSVASGVDVVLYGDVQLNADDAVKVRLSAFNRGRSETIISDETAFVPLMDMFSAFDKISLSVISEMTGCHIGFARIDFKNSGEKGSYEVLIDGAVVGKDLSSIAGWREGSREIIVRQSRMMAMQELYHQTSTLAEGTTETISFAIPRLLPEEKKKIDSLEAEITGLWNDDASVEKVDSDIAEYSGLFSRIDYSSSLSSYRGKASKFSADREIYKREKQITMLTARVSTLEADIAKLTSQNEATVESDKHVSDSLAALTKEMRSHFPAPVQNTTQEKRSVQPPSSTRQNYKVSGGIFLAAGIAGCALCGLSYIVGRDAYAKYQDASSADEASSARGNVTNWDTLFKAGAIAGVGGLTVSAICYFEDSKQHKSLR